MYSDFLQFFYFLSTKILNQGFSNKRLILPFKSFFGRYQHLVEKYSSPDSVVFFLMYFIAYRWRNMVLEITFWFRVNYCFTIMSYKNLYYQENKLDLVSIRFVGQHLQLIMSVVQSQPILLSNCYY